MPVARAPADPEKYLRAQWDTKPRRAEAADCNKENCQNLDTLETIATRASKPWKKLHWWDIALLNWGTADWAEINWYLSHVPEGRQWSGVVAPDKTYQWLTGNPAGFLWVPKLKPEPRIKFRGPGKQDVGHVALDTEADAHLNTLVIPPVYSIDLQLGEIDAMFEPIKPHGVSPWYVKGIRQRLQVLGYLYSPLNHVNISPITEEVWKHYKALNTGAYPAEPLATPAPPVPTDDQLRTRLRDEINHNLVSMIYGEFPTKSGQVHQGRLPAPTEFAAIRLPGGYCHNKGDDYHTTLYHHTSNKHEMGDDRHKLEDELLEQNDMMHAIPLIATVHKVLPDGTTQPAHNVSVYFQLIKPDPLPANCVLKPPDLRATEMDYSKDWKHAELGYAYWRPGTDPDGDAGFELSCALPWTAVTPPPVMGAPPPMVPWSVKRIVQAALAVPADQRDNRLRIDSTAAAPGNAAEQAKIRFEAEKIMRLSVENAAPFEVTESGPKRFVEEVVKANKAADPDDPQADNAPAKFGGKRDIPVQGTPAGPEHQPGVFEVGKSRPGLHTHRAMPAGYTDFGAMTPAEAVVPTEETDDKGQPIKVHAHAVRAITNEQGHACVVFRPSRCGGDRYKIRAYIGPPTLAFNGRDPDGPVVETGTLVVWRNLRIYRYVQWRPPANAGAAHALLTDVFDEANGTHGYADDLAQHWASEQYATGLPTVWLDDAATGEARYNRTARSTQSPSRRYRPINLDFIGLVEQFRRAYCECIIEKHVLQPDRTPQALSQAEYRDALNAGKKAAKASGKAEIPIDWDVLLLDVPSPFLFLMRHRKHYNDVIDGTVVPPGGGAYAGGFVDKIKAEHLEGIRSAVGEDCANAMMAHVAGKGVLPGLTIIQTLDGASWDYFHSEDNICSSGLAGADRACLLHYPLASYSGNFCYSGTANAAHELGHVLDRTHQPPVPNNGDVNFHEPQSKVGIKPDKTTGTCVMGYMGCYGEYCGRCVLAFRGWRTKSQHFPNGA